MQTRLDVRVLTQTNCDLIVVDNSIGTSIPLNDINNYVFVNFLAYQGYTNDPEVIIPIGDSIKLQMGIDASEYTYKFTKDGTFVFYRYGVITLNSPSIFYDNVYHINNRCVYHGGKFYVGKQDINSLNDLTNIDKVVTLEHIEQLQLFTPGLTTDAYLDFWYDEKIFTICHLNQCLTQLQKQNIDNMLINCRGNNGKVTKCPNQDTADMLKYKRDFLFDTVYVLTYLMEIGNLFEAQRILEELNVCGGLCNDASPKGCGCK